MVQNIGGYTRSYGASAPKSETREPLRYRPFRRVAPRLGETALVAEAEATEKRKQALDKAVGAVLGRALDRSELPPDVAQTLLNNGVRNEVIRRVQATVLNMRESGIDIDSMAVAESLTNLDQDVADRIKK